MAMDKVVDSAVLDGALSAMADAIRAKTGGTADIAWDAAAGFASAIGAISSGGANSIVHGTYTAATAGYIAYYMFQGDNAWIPGPSYDNGIILCRTDMEVATGTDVAANHGAHVAVFIYAPTKICIFTIGQRSGQSAQQYYGQTQDRAAADSFSDIANFGAMWTGYYNAGQKVTITETELPAAATEKLFTFAEVTA